MIKNRFVIKVKDIYIFSVFIYIAVAFFAKTTSLFAFLGHITAIIGVLSILFGRRKRGKLIAFLAITVILNIVYFVVSAMVSEVSLQSPTTYGRLIGSTEILVHLVLFITYFSDETEYDHTKYIYIIEIVCLIATFATYSISEIYEGVLGRLRLGERLNGGNLFGMLMALFGIFQCYRIATTKRYKILDILLLLLDLTFVATSGSRKAFLGMFVGVALLFLLISKQNKVLTICKIGLAAGIILYLLSVLNITSGVFDRLNTLWSDTHQDVVRSDDMRSELALFAIQSALKKPLFGYGFNTYTSYSIFHTYAHNNYAELLFNTGFIGVILYYLPKIYILLRLLKLKTSNIKPMTGMYISSIIVLMLYDIACVSYYDTLMNIFYWLGGAYLLHLTLNPDREVVE